MSSTSHTDLLRCPSCLRRFLVADATVASLTCPACEADLELMARSIPGPPRRAASALGAKLLRDTQPNSSAHKAGRPIASTPSPSWKRSSPG